MRQVLNLTIDKSRQFTSSVLITLVFQIAYFTFLVRFPNITNMSKERADIAIQESSATSDKTTLETQYKCIMQTLCKTGITSSLPHTDSPAVISIDGQHYPIPTLPEVQQLFYTNHELVTQKRKQGFTRLQLVPLTTPFAVLKDRVQSAILKHAEEGKIFQAKRHHREHEVPIVVNLVEPLRMLDEYITGELNGTLLYFPRSYCRNHGGLLKSVVGEHKSICAVPGWSISLVEDSPFLNREGQGKTLGGRKQLENSRTPYDYLQAFSETAYNGETGWTPEDFLINFLTRLDETNQVSNDWADYSTAWLTGAYFSRDGDVPGGYWGRGGRRLCLDSFQPDRRDEGWGAPTAVRLS